MRKIILFAITFLILLTAFVGNASAMYARWQNDKLAIEVYPQYLEVNPQTARQQILVKFKLNDGWHISWENPGDAGIPTQFNWTLPDNLTVKQLNSSVPQKFVFAGIVTQYGYGDEAYYLFEVFANKTNSYLPSELKLKINWAVCKDICEPQEAEFTILMPKSGKHNITNPNWNNFYNTAYKTFPQRMSRPAFAEYQNNRLRILFLEPEFNLETQPFYFMPRQRSLFAADAPQHKSLSPDNKLELFIESEDEHFVLQNGLLIYGSKAYEYDIRPMIVYENGLGHGLWYVMLLAFAGGLPLNLMPCVFPVLSLKALSLIHNTDKQNHLKNALLYTLGVLSCFAIVSAILYILRFEGENIGWGFQLQSPWFVGSMLILFIIICLMMCNVIGLSSKILNRLNRLSELNSFLTGFFAVLIASPCTGPFMGAAVGYALFQPAVTYFPIFLSLGLGYALPFALIEMYPQAVKKIMPRPGKWMDVLHKILIIPIVLTCLWLAWVLFNQLHNTATDVTDSDIWQPYNQQQVQNLIDDGQSVFVDFTAKWCLTCLVNEKTTLNTEQFKNWAIQNRVHLFKADWTSKDKDITEALKRYGRNGVPLYIFYSAQDGDLTILPQILTFKMLKDILAEPKDN